MTAGKHDGIAMASACGECAWMIGSPDAWAPGRHMGIVHDSHVPELRQLGWILTGADDGGPPDIACVHYHAAYWQGGRRRGR